MRNVFGLTVLLLVMVGCGQQEAAFQSWKRYLGSTPENAVNPSEAAGLLDRIMADKDCVAFLWKKAKGAEPEKAVAACAAMVEVVHASETSNSSHWQALAAAIGPDQLLQHVKTMDTSRLSSKWQKIHRDNLKALKNDVKQKKE